MSVAPYLNHSPDLKKSGAKKVEQKREGRKKVFRCSDQRLESMYGRENEGMSLRSLMINGTQLL